MYAQPPKWEFDRALGKYYWWDSRIKRRVYADEARQAAAARAVSSAGSTAVGRIAYNLTSSSKHHASSALPVGMPTTVPIDIPARANEGARNRTSDTDPNATPRYAPKVGSPSGLERQVTSLSLSPTAPAPISEYGRSPRVQTRRDQASGVTRYVVTDSMSGVQSTYERGPPEHVTEPSAYANGITANMKFKGSSGAQPGVAETLDPRFQVRKSPRKFFRIGRVFLMLYPEPAGNYETTSTEITFDARFKEPFHVKIRRFVVIREGSVSCTAIAIWTYGGQGVAKVGVKKSDHAIIFTGRPPAPEPLPGERARRNEEPMQAVPIRVDTNDRTETLDSMSRVNFAKVYTIEHNVKVLDFGYVNQHSLPALESQFHTVWFAQSSRRQESRLAREPQPLQARSRADSFHTPVGTSGALQGRLRPVYDREEADISGNSDDESISDEHGSNDDE